MIETIKSKYIQAILEFKNLTKTNNGYVILMKLGFMNESNDSNAIHELNINKAINKLQKCVDNPKIGGTYFSSYNEFAMSKKYSKKNELVQDELLGNVEEETEPSIDELLDREPLKSTKPAGERRYAPAPRVGKGTMVSFIRSSDNKRINSPASLYFVVKGEGGKLHYKEVSNCLILPVDWKEGDPIPEKGLYLPSDYIPGDPLPEIK